jgi:hypothetical protein
VVRGPCVASAYFDNPEASARAVDAEGWFHTGDVAKITPEGVLIIVDRAKDLVKSGASGSRRSISRTPPWRVPASRNAPSSRSRIRSGTSARC